jgi:hypothetical protein
MHVEAGDTEEEARAVEARTLVVVAEHVADVLAEEALDALAVLVEALDVPGRNPPWCAVVLRRVKAGISRFTA